MVGLYEKKKNRWRHSTPRYSHPRMRPAPWADEPKVNSYFWLSQAVLSLPSNAKDKSQAVLSQAVLSLCPTASNSYFRLSKRCYRKWDNAWDKNFKNQKSKGKPIGLTLGIKIFGVERTRAKNQKSKGEPIGFPPIFFSTIRVHAFARLIYVYFVVLFVQSPIFHPQENTTWHSPPFGFMHLRD